MNGATHARAIRSRKATGLGLPCPPTAPPHYNRERGHPMAQPTTIPKTDPMREARIMGAAWQKHGFDVLEKVRLHARWWGTDRAQRYLMAAECLRAAAEFAE
jgi:hypothetical protein